MPPAVHGHVGSVIEPSLTLDGLRAMLQDLRSAGKRMPAAILVSEYDRREINQQLLASSIFPVSRDDQRPSHDGAAIGIVEGVVVMSHPDVPRGRARLVYHVGVNRDGCI